MICPICGLGIGHYDPDLIKIGNTYFHNDCVRLKYKQAMKAGCRLVFVWEGDDCVYVFLDYTQEYPKAN